MKKERKDEKTKKLTVLLSEEEYEKFHKLCRQSGRSMSAFVRLKIIEEVKRAI